MLPSTLVKFFVEFNGRPKHIHSFALKYVLAKMADAHGVRELIPVVQRAPVSNLYIEEYRVTKVAKFDDVSKVATIALNAVQGRGYFLVAVDDEHVELFTNLWSKVRGFQFTGTFPTYMRFKGMTIVKGYKPFRGVHWQTLIVNEPRLDFREPDRCGRSEAYVCHITPEGTKCACQPLMWSDDEKPVVKRVKTVYGVVENPPYPFPAPRIILDVNAIRSGAVARKKPRRHYQHMIYTSTW